MNKNSGIFLNLIIAIFYASKINTKPIIIIVILTPNSLLYSTEEIEISFFLTLFISHLLLYHCFIYTQKSHKPSFVRFVPVGLQILGYLVQMLGDQTNISNLTQECCLVSRGNISFLINILSTIVPTTLLTRSLASEQEIKLEAKR